MEELILHMRGGFSEGRYERMLELWYESLQLAFHSVLR